MTSTLFNQKPSESYEEMRATIETNIAVHGLSIAAIPYLDENGDPRLDKNGNQLCEFAYTIGNYIEKLPEILTFYPASRTNHYVLNDLSRLMKEGKIPVLTDTRQVMMINGLIQNHPVMLHLLTQEQLILADEKFTCQKPDRHPVVLVSMPYPNGEFPPVIPTELLFDYREEEFEPVIIDIDNLDGEDSADTMRDDVMERYELLKETAEAYFPQIYKDDEDPEESLLKTHLASFFSYVSKSFDKEDAEEILVKCVQMMASLGWDLVDTLDNYAKFTFFIKALQMSNQDYGQLDPALERSVLRMSATYLIASFRNYFNQIDDKEFVRYYLDTCDEVFKQFHSLAIAQSNN